MSTHFFWFQLAPERAPDGCPMAGMLIFSRSPRDLTIATEMTASFSAAGWIIFQIDAPPGLQVTGLVDTDDEDAWLSNRMMVAFDLCDAVWPDVEARIEQLLPEGG